MLEVGLPCPTRRAEYRLMFDDRNRKTAQVGVLQPRASAVEQRAIAEIQNPWTTPAARQFDREPCITPPVSLSIAR